MAPRDDRTPSPQHTVADPPQLVVEVSNDTDASHVQLVGELDLLTADQVTGTVSSLVAHGYRWVTLDLSGLGFLDVVGMNALLRAHHHLHQAGGRLTLTGCRPIHRRLFAVTELEGVLHIDGGLVEADLGDG